jgi:PDZ domain
MSIEAEDFGPDRWWETDPFMEGYGLGLVLHQVEDAGKNSWLVARTLEGSPAAESGILAGDTIEGIGSYSASEYGLDELILFLRRPRDLGWVVRSANSKGTSADHLVTTKPLRGLMQSDRIANGNQGGGGCVSCRRCFPTSRGYSNCSADGRCKGSCALV